ncbi:MAG: phosphoglycerate kinase [Legionellales bacterium]|nr:phosphoglycerate kinase [Legionellales bacterium]HAG62423.1 phosphoglycerate kinase [Coxiellaceae bacterium]
MDIPSIYDVSLKHQRVLIREDLNVPLSNGQITSDVRIRAAIPTIQYAIEQQAAVIVMSHIGRPQPGQFDAALSMKPVADYLSDVLSCPVRYVRDWVDGVDVQPGEVVLCENVRFETGEMENADHLSQKMAALCDVFVMDAFATAHRAQASTAGVAKYAPVACAGPLLLSELEAIGQAMQTPERPLVAIVGGSKVSTKLTVLETLLDKVDVLIVGGGIANTFLAASGVNVGASLYEPGYLETAKNIMKKAKAQGVSIPLPLDVSVATSFSPDAQATIKSLDEIDDNDQVLDVGPLTAATYAQQMQEAKTILWNGPVGVFEFPAFSGGTQALGKAIADSSAYSLAGGGDTLAALDQFNLQDQMSYISTGGGAFLEYIEGKVLPAIQSLKEQVKTYE